MTKIVAFCGKKQAGKNTSGNFLFGLEMWSILDPDTQQPLIDWFKVDDKGRLIIPVDFGGELGIKPGIFNPQSKEPAVELFLAHHVWHRVKMYSFADELKELCVKLFNIPKEKVYGGTDADKNSLTNLVWESMPGMPTTKRKAQSYLVGAGFDLPEDWNLLSNMSVRHVLQYVGTEIFRKIYNDVWVNATLNKIEEDSPEIAIITDCRFPNEVKGVQGRNGHVIRLSRAPFAGKDEHISETALDSFKPEDYDSFIDNKDMTVAQQNEVVFNELVRLKVLEIEQ